MPIILTLAILSILFGCNNKNEKQQPENTTKSTEIERKTSSKKSFEIKDLNGSWKLNESSEYVFEDSVCIYRNNGIERLKQFVKMTENCDDTLAVDYSDHFMLYNKDRGSGFNCFKIESLSVDSLVLSYKQDGSKKKMILTK